MKLGGRVVLTARFHRQTLKIFLKSIWKWFLKLTDYETGKEYSRRLTTNWSFGSYCWSQATIKSLQIYFQQCGCNWKPEIRMQDVILYEIYLPGVLNRGTADSKEVKIMSKHPIKRLKISRICVLRSKQFFFFLWFLFLKI